ncbi:MAG TPA: hypothetical protein DCZ03_10565 [Gammaproteobacteria bacterium]|nr:hypothetical protein [Gammaproteobacteria bacterium]
MKYQIRLLPLALALLVILPPSTESSELTAIYELATEHDHQWIAAKAALRAGRELPKLGLSRLLPNISASATYTENSYDGPGTPEFNSDALTDCDFNVANLNEFDPTCLFVTQERAIDYQSQSLSLRLRQPLFQMDRWYDYQKSKALKNQAEWKFDADQQELILRVTETYFDVLRALEDLEFATREQQAVDFQLQQANRRYELGLLANTAVFEAQAAADLSQTQILLAKSGLALALRNLENLTGSSFKEIGRLKADIPISAPVPDTAKAWITRALESNLELYAAKQGVRAAQRETQKNQSGHLPTLNFVSAINRVDTEDGSGFIPPADTESYGVELFLPIFSGGGVSAATRQAYYKFREAEELYHAQKRSVAIFTENQFYLVNAAVTRVTAQKLAIVSNKRAVQATKASFDSGTRTLMDVLNAQRTLLNAERDLNLARIDYILHNFRLKQAVGDLKLEDLSQVSNWLETVPLPKAE